MTDRSETPRPFFETPNAGNQARQRLLLLSYHFPPGQEVGALRWQKLSRYVAERGWGLDVVALDPASLRGTDPSRLAELPPGVRVFGVPEARVAIERLENAVWRAYRRLIPKSIAPTSGHAVAHGRGSSGTESLSRAEMRWARHLPRDLLRSYFAWLEYTRDGSWARAAAAVALGIADSGVHQAVISCGPPHMVHEAGRRVSLAAGIPLVVDMRDPWRLVQRLPEPIASPLWLRLAEYHERRAISQASLVVANTEPAGAKLRELYPQHADRVIAVMNGYDEELLPEARHTSRFVIAYAGTIYLDRDPRLLFRAAARIVSDLHLTPEQFGIDLLGNVDSYGGVPILAMAREEGLEGFVTVGPPKPRSEAMEFIARSTMLLSLPQDSDMAIPSKIFEYMRFRAWIFALAERGSATDLLLRGTDADVVPPNDFDGMVAVLRRRYAQHAAGIEPPCVAQNQSFSRRSQAQVLLDAIVARCSARAPERNPIPGAVPSRSVV